MLINTSRPRQDGRYFADSVLKCIFLNENVWILLKIPQKFVPRGPINIIPALVQIMAWRRPGDKPLSQPMLVFVPTHIFITPPQWVKELLFWMYHQSIFFKTTLLIFNQELIVKTVDMTTEEQVRFLDEYKNDFGMNGVRAGKVV